MDKNIFKANDIRGIYPLEINKQVVFKIVSGISAIFKKNIVVGHDARLSSPELYKSVLAALKEIQPGKSFKKIKIIEAGLATTPEIYFLVNKFKADGGIIVTASHNPKEYNGLKIMGRGAIPISGREVMNKVFVSSQAASLITANSLTGFSSHSFQKVRFSRHAHLATKFLNKPAPYSLKVYASFLKKHLKVSRKLKIVVDCSSGTTGMVLKNLFKSNKKITAVFLNEKPNGNFPAHSPNPLVAGSLDRLKEVVVKQKADLGIIFDGDGDRVFFMDNLGRQVDPDAVGFILTNKNKPPFVVSTISSSRVKNIRGTFVSKVGHLFMKEMMRNKKANLGMERSGHYYFKKFFYCDSGILAALEIINFVVKLKNNFSEYLDVLPRYYQIEETNFEIKDKKIFEKKLVRLKNFYKKSAQKIIETDGLLMEFDSVDGKWWFSLRFSNSENLLRLNLEANNQSLLSAKFIELKSFIL